MRRALALACVLGLAFTWPAGLLAPLWLPFTFFHETSVSSASGSSVPVQERAPRPCGSSSDLGVLVPLATQVAFPVGEPAEVEVFLHNPGPLEAGLGGIGPVVPGFNVHRLPDFAEVARVHGGSGAYPVGTIHLPVGSTVLLAMLIVDVGPDVRGVHLVTFETHGLCGAAALTWA